MAGTAKNRAPVAAIVVAMVNERRMMPSPSCVDDNQTGRVVSKDRVIRVEIVWRWGHRA